MIRGPDWMWGSQGDGEEGVVQQIKDWKGIPQKGVRVRWDNGESNMYRYGAENCYDVVEWARKERLTRSVYPMRREDYRPVYGVIEASESGFKAGE